MTSTAQMFEDLDWAYPNEDDARLAFTEAFVEKEYFFRSSSESPLIVDCGAHIGASVLFFKSIFPDSHIIAFEPNPMLFGYLTGNVERNKLTNVDLREFALSDADGQEYLFGGFDGEQSTLGNSTSRAWGERPQTQNRVVIATRLSPFLDRPIDFLKINIEGAECKVLREIFDSGAINRVDQLYVQFHLCTEGNSYSDIESILQMLSIAGFSVSLNEKEFLQYLPATLSSWAASRRPRILAAHASRRSTLSSPPG